MISYHALYVFYLRNRCLFKVVYNTHYDLGAGAEPEALWRTSRFHTFHTTSCAFPRQEWQHFTDHVGALVQYKTPYL